MFEGFLEHPRSVVTAVIQDTFEKDDVAAFALVQHRGDLRRRRASDA